MSAPKKRSAGILDNPTRAVTSNFPIAEREMGLDFTAYAFIAEKK